MLLTGGTASAEPTAANSCGEEVEGEPGEEVVLSGTAIQDLVEKGADNERIVHGPEWGTVIKPSQVREEIAGQQLVIGTIPNGETTIGGNAIADQVVQTLDGHRGLGLTDGRKAKTLASIHDEVSSSKCQVKAASTPVQTASSDSGHGGTQDSTPSDPGTTTPGSSTGDGATAVTPDDYGEAATDAIPGTGGHAPAPSERYGSSDSSENSSSSSSEVPAPEFGLLGPGDGGEDSESLGDVHNAGNTIDQAADDAASEQVQLPMLLAVVALAGVTAALVRTWVLRRVTGA